MTSTDINTPFTRAERIQHLAEIDHDITTLLEWSGKAIQSLGNQPPIPNPSTTTVANQSPEAVADARKQSQAAQVQSFQESIESFLTTIHSIDTRLKRQILGLEEAGIINLGNGATSAADDAAGINAVNSATAATSTEGGASANGGTGAPTERGEVTRPSIGPNGIGKIGTLDVGWLNSRSNQVEKDLEAELWTRAREHLESVIPTQAASTDAEMKG